MSANELIHGSTECVRELERLKPISARAVQPRIDGIRISCDYHGLTFDVWYRVEGIYVPATEFDAEERPDVVIVHCELYGSEIDFHALPMKVRDDILGDCREYERDAR